MISNHNYRRSGAFAAVVLLWLLSGQFRAESQQQPAPPPLEPRELTAVTARYVEAQIYRPKVRVRARTEAQREVDVAAEVAGRITALPAAEGQRVAAGDVLCELAVEDREVRLQEAESAVAQAQLEYDGAQRLRSEGLQSRTAIAAARAALDAALAARARARLNLDNTRVRAPFAGLVERYPVEIGTFVQPGQTCARLLQLDPLVIAGRVSEAEVGRLQLGSGAAGTLLSGEQVEGEVVFIGHEADEVTRTFRVEVSVPNESYRLRSGISADLTVPLEPVQAHRVPSALLSLDDRGRIGLRIVDDGERVRFVLVDLVGDDVDGVWVSGLPQRALLITVGQEYVSNGQQVAVSLETGRIAPMP